jgi:hypothetical protein
MPCPSLAALALAAALPGAAPLEHTPVACVPTDRYTRISARAGAPVAGAELQFRLGPDGDWYAVRMTAQGETWSGVLPRPQPRLERFEYRLAVTDARAAVSYSDAYAVAVGACAGDGAESAAEVAEPIVVRVPAGAPVVPPVPAGFSPAGVVGAEAPPRSSPWRKVAWIAGGVAAGGIAAAASGAGAGPAEPPNVPDFSIATVSPGPGSQLSISRDRVTVFVEVRGEPATPLTFSWVVGLSGGQRREPCLIMSDVAAIGSERPSRLALSAPLRTMGLCGTVFDVLFVTVTIVVDGQVVREMTEPVTYRFGV